MLSSLICKATDGGIVVGLAVIGHRHDAGLQVRRVTSAIACCRSVVKVAIPQRRGSELPMKAIRRSGVMSAPRQGLSDCGERGEQLGRAGLVDCSPSFCNKRIDRIGLPDRRSEPLSPSAADFDAGATAVDEDRLADRRAQPVRSRAWPSSTRIQVSGSACSAQFELARQFNPLEHEMRACDEDRSLGGEAARTGLAFEAARHAATATPLSFVQFALPAIVEQAECRVAALLNFGEHDAGADGVDRAGRDEDDVAFRDRTPLRRDRRSSRP